MLEITGDDIAALSDEDLRTLVGLLCEADLARRRQPLSVITWGGDQSAKDGGIDVRVALSAGTPISGFIPRPNTGYQVKKQDMPPRAIRAEMKPGDVLRPAIVQLAEASGAYVIVSSAGSTSDSALRNRKAAMTSALQDMEEPGRLAVDFYDRNRLATWVREHPGVVVWVRAKVGRLVAGWRPYGSWSRTPQSADPTYLLDQGSRIRFGDKDDRDGLTAVEGIDKIRKLLSVPGGVVRLVGVSGVGKTRLVEALFDSTVGTGSLDPSLAIYTDVADDPDPQPAGMAADLVAHRRRSILVVDNCPPAIHRQLSDAARTAGSEISVISIEYDIREDQPEGTDVVLLETSSIELIEKLVSKRFPDLSQIDQRTIAEFSGGNARIALALASIVARRETVAQLSDSELFRRLFHQRHESDASLLAIAEVCSLVYSFDGETITGDESELSILGKLIGRSAEDLFRGLAELKRRDLLQARGPWRAVLPHAIANRLGAMALQNIPEGTLNATFRSSPARLLRSFSRRLGYLDSSKEARAIVQGWLGPGGLLYDVASLNELGSAMLANVAPVAPEAVLAALENALSTTDSGAIESCRRFVPLIRSVAYDTEYFERAVSLLVKLGRSDDKEVSGETVDAFESLFTIALSGTHAPLQMRLATVDRLLRSANAADQGLGVKALAAMLKSDHFMSPYSFAFGARSRDHGYYPRSGEDVRTWFAGVLQMAEPFAVSDEPLGEEVRGVIAKEFRALWTNTGQAALLDRLSRSIGEKRFWREGWISARATRRYDLDELPPDVASCLNDLVEFLRPKDLAARVRGLALGQRFGIDLEDLEDDSDEDYLKAADRVTAVVEKLGRDLGLSEETFKELLPLLLVGSGRIGFLGRGVALSSPKPAELWSEMVRQAAVAENATADFMCGFIDGLHGRDRALANALMDDAVNNTALAKWIPFLQRNIGLDEAGLSRIHRVLQSDKAPITNFLGLAHGRTCDALAGSEFDRLVMAIADKPNGMRVALEMLSMRVHSDRMAKRQSSPETIQTGRKVLARYRFHRTDGRTGHESYQLGEIVKASLVEAEAKAIVRQLSRDLAEAVSRHEASAHDYGHLLTGLFEVHPTEVLDELLSGDEKSRAHGTRLLSDLWFFGQAPMGNVPDEVILRWCDVEPEVRYPLAAGTVLLFTRPNDKAPHEWTSLCRQLLRRAPSPTSVFQEIVTRLHPRGWSGSLATKLESRLELLERLRPEITAALNPAFEQARGALKRRIEDERRRETAEERQSSGRFE